MPAEPELTLRVLAVDLDRPGQSNRDLRDTDEAVMPSAAIPAEARAGDIVVFSSLTPHATGPNRTRDIRKAYIVQFAPDGAEILSGAARTRCDAPERQFPILVDGEAPA